MNTADLFQVDSVEATTVPDDVAQGSWCRYVISNRRSRVVGRYRGTVAQTRRNAEQLASSFNERALSGRAPGNQRPQSRRKPARAGTPAAKVPR
jgi:hypothetical protein